MKQSAKTDRKSFYLPVAWEYRESLEDEIRKERVGKIFYFDDHNQLEQAEGRIVELFEQGGEGVFIRLDREPTGSQPQCPIRIDRIITVFGKIGPAYDEYDAFANSCMDCKGD